jgi:hypothetical protein
MYEKFLFSYMLETDILVEKAMCHLALCFQKKVLINSLFQISVRNTALCLINQLSDDRFLKPFSIYLKK